MLTGFQTSDTAGTNKHLVCNMYICHLSQIFLSFSLTLHMPFRGSIFHFQFFPGDKWHLSPGPFFSLRHKSFVSGTASSSFPVSSGVCSLTVIQTLQEFRKSMFCFPRKLLRNYPDDCSASTSTVSAIFASSLSLSPHAACHIKINQNISHYALLTAVACKRWREELTELESCPIPEPLANPQLRLPNASDCLGSWVGTPEVYSPARTNGVGAIVWLSKKIRLRKP